MIKVIYDRPVNLPIGAQFKYKAHNSLKFTEDSDGTLIENYSFYKCSGEIKAIFRGLDVIHCTAHIIVEIQHEHDAEYGEIRVWDEESQLIAEEAAASISQLVRDISRANGQCTLLLEYTLTRDITSIS